MKKRLMALVFSLLVISISARSQQPLVGIIQGMIVDQKQAPIPYPSLTLTNIDSVEKEAHRRTMVAGQKGSWQMVDVPEGRYSIVVTKKGYRDYRMSMVIVRGGETVNLPPIRMSPANGH